MKDIKKEIREILEKLVFYAKGCISGRTAHSNDWDKEIDLALSAIRTLIPQTLSREELQDIFTDLVDKNFPKGECKERGAAIVLIAQAIIALSNKIAKSPPEEIEQGVATIFYEQLKGLYAVDPISALEAIKDMIDDKDAEIERLRKALKNIVNLPDILCAFAVRNFAKQVLGDER